MYTFTVQFISTIAGFEAYCCKIPEQGEAI